MTTWQIEFELTAPEAITYSATTAKAPLVIEAEYYQREAGWVTFKDATNKPVFDAALSGVNSIRRVEAVANAKERVTTVTLKANVTGYIEDMHRATAATNELAQATKARQDAASVDKLADHGWVTQNLGSQAEVNVSGIVFRIPCHPMSHYRVGQKVAVDWSGPKIVGRVADEGDNT